MKSIGITDYVNPPFDIESEALGNGYELVSLGCETEKHFSQKDLSQLDGLLVWHAPISEKTAARLSNCKITVRYGVGFDAININALEENGIAFCNTPDYGTEEVADTAAAMIMNHVRRLGEYDYQCRHYKHGWQEHTIKPLPRTNMLTLGIIGVGRIGTALIRRLRPFSINIIGYDPYQPSGHEKSLCYERMQSIDDLLKRSDIVSIHCPATSETRGMIDQNFIAKMKVDSVLVNTARGSLIASLDPIEMALRKGSLRAVALDVLPTEPPVSHPLIDAWRNEEPWLRGRLTITPHTAYFSDAAWREMRYKAAETIRIFFENGILRNHVRAA